MNIKIFHLIAIFSWTTVISVSGMYNSAFRAIQLVTGGALIGKGFYDFDRHNKILKNPVYGEPISGVVEEFLRKKMSDVDMPQSDTVPLCIDDRVYDWAVRNDKAIVASRKTVDSLKQALETKPLVDIRRQELIDVQNNRQYYSDDELSDLDYSFDCVQKIEDRCDSDIAYALSGFKHELKHYFKKDAEIRGYVKAILPIAVQSVCSAATYTVNKIACRKGPATLLSCFIRSRLSIIGMIPKIALNSLGLILYKRHQEKEADRFACEHAESRLELEERYNDYHGSSLLFQEKHCKDLSFSSDIWRNFASRWRYFRLQGPSHPDDRDRAAMFKEYLDAWGLDHKN